jgi:hypothetical protein
VTSTTQKREKNNIELDSFSQQVFSTNHLRKPFFHSIKFAEIINALGPLIEDQNGNIFYDLRLSSNKPFWGHSLPLTLKYVFKNEYELPTKTISFMNIDKNLNPDESYTVKEIFFCEETLLPKKLYSFKNLYLYFSKDIVIKFNNNNFKEYNDSNEKLINFINTVLVSGSRVKEIQERIKNFCKNDPSYLNQGLNIIIKNTNKTQMDFAKECINISESNFINDSLYLNLPTSFTNNSLDDLFDRITNVLRK